MPILKGLPHPQTILSPIFLILFFSRHDHPAKLFTATYKSVLIHTSHPYLTPRYTTKCATWIFNQQDDFPQPLSFSPFCWATIVHFWVVPEYHDTHLQTQLGLFLFLSQLIITNSPEGLRHGLWERKQYNRSHYCRSKSYLVMTYLYLLHLSELSLLYTIPLDDRLMTCTPND